MEVFLMIRRQNRTIFLDAKESTSVAEIKRQLEGITKYSVEEQLLLKDDITLRNDKQLRDYNITKSTAPSHSPVTLGLCLMENGHFETLNVTPYSKPLQLPDRMANQQESEPMSN